MRGEGGGWSSVTRGGLRMVGSRSRAGEGIVGRELVACAAVWRWWEVRVVMMDGAHGGEAGEGLLGGAHREFSRQADFKLYCTSCGIVKRGLLNYQ